MNPTLPATLLLKEASWTDSSCVIKTLAEARLECILRVSMIPWFCILGHFWKEQVYHVHTLESGVCIAYTRRSLFESKCQCMIPIHLLSKLYGLHTLKPFFSLLVQLEQPTFFRTPSWRHSRKAKKNCNTQFQNASSKVSFRQNRDQED